MKTIKTLFLVIVILALFVIGTMWLSNKNKEEMQSTTANIESNSRKILTLGESLSEEQIDLIYSYLGIEKGTVETIVITNEDERKYLEGIVDTNTIGTRTFSCAYIELTESGGIHTKTVNLDWVNGEMLRNALVTSGIENCNVIAVAPIQVSGTGSLTGVFKAYETINNISLDEDKKELAAEELVTTASLSDTVGDNDAVTLISNIKDFVITSDIIDENSIKEKIEEYISENKIELTEEQKWQIVEFMLKLSEKEYDIEEIKGAYKDIKQTMSDVKEAADKTKSILIKIGDFFNETWDKINGTYEEIKKSEEYEILTEQLGILADTNESLLGENTIVTTTENEDILDNIKNSIDNVMRDNNISFDDFSIIKENNKEEIKDINNDLQSSTNNESGMLQYITLELQDLKLNNNDNSATNDEDSHSGSFEDLFN